MSNYVFPPAARLRRLDFEIGNGDEIDDVRGVIRLVDGEGFSAGCGREHFGMLHGDLATIREMNDEGTKRLGGGRLRSSAIVIEYPLRAEKATCFSSSLRSYHGVGCGFHPTRRTKAGRASSYCPAARSFAVRIAAERTMSRSGSPICKSSPVGEAAPAGLAAERTVMGMSG